MMRPLSRAFLLTSIALGTLSAAPHAFAQNEASSADVAQQQKARRQAAVRDAMLLVQQARQAYTEKKYTDAVDLYRSALSVIPKAPASEKQVRFIKDSLSDALIAKAIDYRQVGRSDEAREFLLEAIELSPDNKRAHRELSYTDDPIRTNPALTPEHVGNVHEVQRLLTLAEGYYGLGQYDQAISTYRSVLKIDKYNSAAQRGIERCNNRKMQYSADARDAYRAKALSDVDATYDMTPPTGPYFEPIDARAQELSEQTRQDSTSYIDGSAYQERLSQIILPQVILEEATINDVVDLLRAEIRRDEANNQGTTRGHINVIPYFGTVDSPGYKDLQNRRVTLNLSQISITGLLDILCNQMGISYYFDDKGLILTYSGKDFGPLIDRSFIVPPHFFDRTRDDYSEEEDEDGGFSSISVSRIDPKATLKSYGISFPEGSHVRYIPSERIMHVRNTAYNIDQIAELLNVPLSEHRVVVMSIIMVQVSEEQLDDLGFEWMFNASLGGKAFAGGGVTPTGATTAGVSIDGGIGDAAVPHVTDGLRSGASVLAASNIDRLISTGSVSEYVPSDTSKSPGIFGLRGIWNTADVTVLMRGLAQQKGVDVLQRPQIVFQPDRDEQISFGSVRELFFPSSYDSPSIESVNINGWGRRNRNNNAQAVAAIPAHPTDFTRFGMSDDELNGFGTIIQVHNAEINADASAVTLSLTTTLNEFEGFVNWGQPIEAALWQQNNLQMVRLTDNQILQPMIKRYRINTKVTVASGSVLVLGGLKEARVIEYEDKIPVLGDLPLVGRLFRSEGSSRTRKAVLYFAKVDIVDPTGRDFQTGDKPSDQLIATPEN